MHLLLPLQDTSQINCVYPSYDVPTISLIVSFMLLQVHVHARNPLITVFALHFSSCEIHCFQGLGKVTMMKEASLKACNKIVHGLLDLFRVTGTI